MTRDMLSEATRALADLGDEPAPQASTTRARVLSELRNRSRRRIERRMFLLPAAAIVLLGTAAAAASGSLDRAWQWVDSALSAPTETEHATPSSAVSSAAATGTTTQRVTVAPPEDPAEPTTPEQKEAAAPPQPSADTPSNRAAPATTAALGSATVGANTRAAPPLRAGSAAAVGASTAPRPTAADPAIADADPSHGLYRDAHQAHFAARDYARALSAWDRYLQAAPGGRFALEARYNRAICLLHLGNTGAARRALQPFADGKFGSYRKDEATRLLSAIDRRDAAADP